jgi:hypothetical protein
MTGTRTWQVSEVYLWSMGSYDIQGVHPASHCRIDRIADAIAEHNSQAMRQKGIQIKNN